MRSAAHAVKFGSTALTLLMGAAIAVGCARIHGDSCSIDEDCDKGRVCREAACRRPCLAGRWVGERVEVLSGKSVKPAEVTACEQRRYWVRYESGVEEQVDDTRLLNRARVSK
ncbi:MAG TPA: hypothetical protein PLI95_15540 [Polyangiaceae bacterium]|nr:hypothetical protein [Polyangiaceae bacterium]